MAAVLDSQSGELVAVHGGDVAMATDFNRATQALRQAGSSLKPLVYAMAFSELDDDHAHLESQRHRAQPSSNI